MASPIHNCRSCSDGQNSMAGLLKTDLEPYGANLIVPTEAFEPPRAADTLKKLKDDLVELGMRARRGHDLRRTFITLAQVDGARREVLKPLTHPGDSDIVGLYTSFPWPTVCEEVAKLRVYLPEGGGGGPGVGDTEINTVSGGPTVATVASYSPDCSSGSNGKNGVILSRCPDLNRGPTVYELGRSGQIEAYGVVWSRVSHRKNIVRSRLIRIASDAPW